MRFGRSGGQHGTMTTQENFELHGDIFNQVQVASDMSDQNANNLAKKRLNPEERGLLR
ncbi:hypothetical protein ACP70R_047794 [Stipagrostis hirtigluma subsp. patula]